MHPIVLDFYQGANGPTLRIEVHSDEQIMLLRDVAEKLKSGAITEIHVRDMQHIITSTVKDVILRRHTDRYHPTCKVIETTDAGPVILWAQDNTGWDNTEGLLEGLLGSQSGGHQYFPFDPYGNAEVDIEVFYIK